jgi:hypothetical protein
VFEAMCLSWFYADGHHGEGEPPGQQSDAPSLRVQGRQYTGLLVTITNDKLFDSPVYNYSREFPYIWEETKIPVPYRANWHDSERILLKVARKHTLKSAELSRQVLDELCRRHFLRETELEPRVFCRLTDNWLEMSVRFYCPGFRCSRIEGQDEPRYSRCIRKGGH